MFLESRLDIIFLILETHMSTSHQTKLVIFRESSKKTEYMQRVLEFEHATFTRFVVGTNGRMGEECSRFF